MAKAKINIVALVNRINAGDDDKAYAVQRELQEQLTKQGYEVVLHIADINKDLATLPQTLAKSGDYSIVVGGGEHCIAPLVNLKKAESLKGKIYTSWTGHQLFASLPAAANDIDSIGLPTHIDTSKLEAGLYAGAAKESKGNEKAGNLIKTIGVIHNSRPESLVAEYAKVRTRLTPASKYQFIYLAGDAPTPDGKTTLYYTAEEAYALGRQVGKNVDASTVILATNGPRTGQFVLDKSTSKMVKDDLSHHDIDPKTLEPLAKREMDAVSAAFVKGLRESGVSVSCDPKLSEAKETEGKATESRKRAQFFDFRFVLGQDASGKAIKTGNSVYKGLLGAVAVNQGSTALLPGESVSAPSEACDLLPAGVVSVFKNKAMNQDHSTYLQSLYESGQVKVWEMVEKDTIISLSEQVSKAGKESAVKQSAAKVMATRAVSDVGQRISAQAQSKDYTYLAALQKRMLPCSDGWVGQYFNFGVAPRCMLLQNVASCCGGGR